MRGPNPQSRFVRLGKITVPFGGKTTQENFHPGIDVANSSGTPIYAPVDGVITKVDGGHVKGENNFGNTVELKDSEGQVHQFHHLQDIKASLGQQVKQGQEVATLGQSGATYSPSGGDSSNLDYRIITSYGKYRNPLMYLQKL